VCIPVYNFGPFIGQTLDSILSQSGLDDEVEVLVVDGASTDNTREVIAAYKNQWPALQYIRLAKRGGIDADIAESIRLAKGDYCWLFSGDDLMRAGAMARALKWLDQSHDVYVCKHTNCDRNMNAPREHPVFSTDNVRIAELSNPEQRLNYLADGVTTEALFSFMSTLLIRRSKWASVECPAVFMGGCWAHAARLLEAAKSQLRVCYVGEVWLDKRGDNDSFLDKGIVNRLRIAIDGYQNIVNQYFGPTSLEAFHVRRYLRNDLTLPVWMHAKRRTTQAPDIEDRQELDRLMDACYGDKGLSCSFYRSIYHHVPVMVYRILWFALRSLRSLYRRVMSGSRH
jgi:abequosyltransferase